ncbi:MAG TPA: vanadium-dependent haloperoxidase [Gemmatimonadales bacterium]|nr:vanadium-dependent haloperoxidase [Gemmatimonadales bacterium]
MKLQISALAILASATLATACSEQATTPTELQPPGADASWGRHQDVGATASWNELATSLADRTVIDPARLYAYLSLAQFRASEAADGGHRGRAHSRWFRRHYRDHLAISAAIGGASAAILHAFFPNDGAEIDAALAAQAATARDADDFVESADLGADIAAEVMAYAAGDRVGLADPGTPPIGDGYWKWSGGPIVRANYRARPFFLASDSQFRPAPPPMFGSPAYLAALAEVRQISDNRTSEQLAIATYWNIQQSGRRNAPFENKAVELIRKYRVGDALAARIMFTMNAAMYDAVVGCFDAKYAYWFIRPPQADPGITTPIGLPPHPSYPSAHSCVSGSMSGVLMAFFPRDAASLDQMSQEASLSRLYAGIHYRFDMDAGIALGRRVARLALRTNLDQVAVLP